jgi:SAM-dependent methyltransferase
LPFLFAVTLFVSATLLFLVQPMIGKMVLPLLGGSPAVWNTCMVFFQGVLLAGYLYAHGLTRRLSPRAQALLHGGVLLLPLVPLLWLRFDADSLARTWLPPPAEANPIPWLLALLGLAVGLPFFVVATSAPLLQDWFARTGHPAGKDPYFLYAASNLGSLVGLNGYIAVIEPNFRLGTQTWIWLGGYALLVLLTWLCGLQLTGTRAGTTAPAPEVEVEDLAPASAPSAARWLRWIALAFVPSSLMLGVTTYVTTDVAAIPLLWVIPLDLYLLSFILVFAKWPALVDKLLAAAMAAGLAIFIRKLSLTISSAYDVQGAFPTEVLRGLLYVPPAVLLGLAFWPKVPPLLHKLMVVLLPLVVLVLAVPPPYEFTAFGRQVKFGPSWWEVPSLLIHFLALFVAAMVCHGELARTRPAPRYLTGFYLCMSVGGVLGGLFNALVAPVAFDKVVEYPLVIALACLLLPRLGLAARAGPWHWLDLGVSGAIGVFGVLMTALMLANAFLTVEVVDRLPESLQRRIIDYVKEAPEWRRPRDLYVVDGRLNPGGTVLYQGRNFFGLLRVQESMWHNRTYHGLVHGRIDHGKQCFKPEEYREQPITYFHRKGPVGHLFNALRARGQPAYSMAVLGVGTGTLAAYAEPGWSLTLYDIDAAVVRLARDPQYFTFLTDCEKRGVNVEVILGDGRLKVAKAPEASYDVLFMDAFQSDAVPVHLITREAIELYKQKLKPDGLLVINIANRYINFQPVLGNLAEATKLEAIVAVDRGNSAEDRYPSHWVVMARDHKAFGTLLTAAAPDGESEGKPWFAPLPPDRQAGVGVWTDDFSNILRVLYW